MTIKDTGGSAFPCEAIVAQTELLPGSQGMTLRAYFAAKAPPASEDWINLQQGIDKARNPYNEPHKPVLRDRIEIQVAWAWKWADTMIAYQTSGI